MSRRLRCRRQRLYWWRAFKTGGEIRDEGVQEAGTSGVTSAGSIKVVESLPVSFSSGLSGQSRGATNLITSAKCEL
jgi:hypothetical protein